MAAILVSGGTYSGSGDLTCEAVVLGGKQGEDWGDSTFICPDGVLEITGNSSVGYSDSAIFVYNNSNDTWTHNGGTVRFTGGVGDKQNVTDYANAPWAWNNVEIQNDNTSTDEGVRWGNPWKSDTDIAGDLTISGNADYYVHNDAAQHYVVSGTVNIISGAFTRNATPINSDESNSFGILVIGDNGSYIAAANGGEILSITKSSNNTEPWGDHYGFYNDGGTFTHNDGTVSFDYQTSYQNLRADSQWFYNLTSTNRETSYDVGVQMSDNNLKVANDLVVASGASIDTKTYTVTVSGTVYCSGNWGTVKLPHTSTQKNKKTLGGLVVGPTGAFTAPNDTGDIPGLTFTDVADASYAIRVKDDVSSGTGSFYHNDGTVLCAKIAGGVQELWLEGNDLYNLNIAPVGGTIVYISNNDLAAGLTVANDLNVAAGKTFKTFGAGLSRPLTVSGTATVSGTLGVSTETSDWTFGVLDIKSGGAYQATQGTTKFGVNFAGGTCLFIDENATFTHNNGKMWGYCDHATPTNMNMYTSGATFYDFSWYHRASYGNTWWGDTTVENLLWLGDGGGYSYLRMNYDDKMTLGTATSSAILHNDGTKWQTNHSYLYGASELYPFEFSGSQPTFNTVFTREKWGKYLMDVDIDDGSTFEFRCDGAMEFQGVEIVADNTLNCEDQRVEFGGLLDINGGTIRTPDSLLVLHEGIDNDGSWYDDSSCDVMISGGAGWMDIKPCRTIFTMGDAQQLQNANFNKLIIGGGTTRIAADFDSVDNLIIANGGTLDHYGLGGVVENGTSFSNRGGLFASSSAVFTDGVKGVSSQYVQAATFSDLNSATASTMEVWFKIDNTKPMDQAGIINPLGTNRMQITVSSNPVSASGNYRLGFEWENGGTEIWNSGKVQDWDDTKWHHAAMTCDDTDGYKLYFDGKLEASGAALGNSAGSTVVANPTVMVGGQNDYGYINRAFAGTIARASIWDTALTSAQIRTMLFQDFDTATTTNCVLWWQFDEGEGGTVADKSGQGNTGTLSGTATNTTWATGGTWTAGGTLSSSAGNLYIGNRGTDATVFASSYFPIGNRKLISGSKFASKAHEGTYEYYIATSGTNDYLLYAKLSGAPIGVHNDVKIVPPTTGTTEGSYFTFDANADNEQCNTLVNYGGSYVRILTNEDFYTQDFDNQGTWVRNPTYDGIIHDDGSTPHEYNPIDIMDDQDSGFDAEDLID